MNTAIYLGAATAILVLISIVLIRKVLVLQKRMERFGEIPDLDVEREKLLHENLAMRNKLSGAGGVLKRILEKHQELEREISVFEDKMRMIDFGFYTPKYDFKDAEGYKDKLAEIRDKQRRLIETEKAVVCGTNWQVGNSRQKGKAMVNRNVKLGLTAFNVQCDNAILKVKFNNVKVSEERIRKIERRINSLMKSMDCHLTEEFVTAKIEELRLAYEYALKVEEEKEEQRRVRELMREEEKVQRDIELAEKEAEAEEKIFQKALDKARRELAKASDEESNALNLKIAELERQLAAAHVKKERAMSMAEQTKRGHIYIVSNVGSFGEGVYKIGMTRRLEPMDRVRELGDASVPFTFDVHAMIYSDDAPALEKALHDEFAHNRVNLVNNRKEFFAVSLGVIQGKCKDLDISAKFIEIAEAQQFRESLAIRSERNNSSKDNEIEELLKAAEGKAA